MFERFGHRARQVIVLAQDEARMLGHDYIGTEHLLLGLLREKEGVASRVLESFGVELEDVRARVAQIVGEGEEARTGQIPFTPQAKRVLERAMRESLVLRQGSIGTEHLLLGLTGDEGSVAFDVLRDFGADESAIRSRVEDHCTAGRHGCFSAHAFSLRSLSASGSSSAG